MQAPCTQPPLAAPSPRNKPETTRSNADPCSTRTKGTARRKIPLHVRPRGTPPPLRIPASVAGSRTAAVGDVPAPLPAAPLRACPAGSGAGGPWGCCSPQGRIRIPTRSGARCFLLHVQAACAGGALPAPSLSTAAYACL